MSTFQTEQEQDAGRADHNVLAALNDARRQLLDLTFRNNFLNYRTLKAQGLTIIDDEAARVADLLVGSDATFKFIAREEAHASRDAFLERRERGRSIQDDAVQSSAIESQIARDSASSSHKRLELLAAGEVSTRLGLNDRVLVAGHSSEDLDKRLLRTLKLAQTQIEERGVNTLFIALGALKWTESDSSDQTYTSPLYIVPISLERSNDTHGVVMRYAGEDVQGNQALHERLKQQGVDLPLPDDESVLSVYLDSVAAAVSPKARWSVDTSHVSIGFFSFTRYMMYLDLDPARWAETTPIGSHPVIRSLLGTGFDQESWVIDEESRLDGHPAYDEAHHVLEADSSQTRAVAEALASKALVIQGPPGTGKSQTIANLLAEAVAQGKRVLFVSEKKAALDVVKRRLDEVGLGDAALELHSNKATRATVVGELKRTIELGRPRAGSRADNLQRLQELRAVLNAYADALHEPIGNTGTTPYRLFGALSALSAVEPIDLTALGINIDGTWDKEKTDALIRLAEEIENWASTHGLPNEHKFRHIGLEAVQLTLENRWPDLLTRAAAALHDLGATRTSPLAIALEADILSISKAQTLAKAGQQLAGAVTRTPGMNLASAAWMNNRRELREAAANARRVVTVRRDHAASVSPEAWDRTGESSARLKSLYVDLTRQRHIFYRWFDKRYRRAAAKAMQFLPAGRPKTHGNLDAAIKALNAHAEASDAFHSTGVTWRQVLPTHGEVSAAATMAAAVEAVCDVLDEHPQLTHSQLAALARLGESQLQAEIERILDATRAASEALNDLFHAIQLNVSNQFGKSEIAEVQLEQLQETIAAWPTTPDSLRAGARWQRTRGRAIEAGLSALTGAAEMGSIPLENLSARIKGGVYRAWLEAAFIARPALAAFDIDEQATAITNFRELDAARLTINRSLLALKHFQDLPRLAGYGQTGVLQQEFNKRRRHLPIRRLMREAGSAIQAIKPIFMMSPLSVAVYLPPGAISFDLVIFDEASQVRPADALGAILRGTQAVVVGDDKQLPPTSFFDSLLEDDEVAEDFAVSDVESILGLFGARGSKQVMLKWHYRSRHESLIAVSNQEFYDNRLLIFPSPDVAREQSGVVFHHVPEAVYDRGHSRTNRDEARAIAQHVLEHARNNPSLSLGVATFSSAQADAVQTELEVLTSGEQRFVDFLNRHPNETFFVKNLETVQGDERDIIIISIGYGKDASGRLSYHFGPLNRERGERRLNVLITRARVRTEIFANFTDEDMNPESLTSIGMRALQKYIAFARTGVLELPELTDRDDESPFEDAVAAALRDRGHLVHRQVGQAGYYIDMAIADPKQPGRMVLGIECDGATYHSSRSARERDRLRQAVLEGLGWRIHRIWSTDWFRNPSASLERAERAIRDAFAECEDLSTPTKAAGAHARSSPEPESFELERTTVGTWHRTPTRAVPYRPGDYSPINLNTDFHLLSTSTIAGWLAEVVQAETPVHRRIAFRRILDRVGISRMGSRVGAKLQEAVQYGLARKQFTSKGDALLSPGFSMTSIHPRDRSALNGPDHDFSLIPQVEIDAAIVEIVRVGFGARQDELAPAVTQLLGFGRASGAIQETVNRRVEALLNERVLLKSAQNGAEHIRMMD